MLIQFTFNNYKCFRGETTLSMVAADLRHPSGTLIKYPAYDVLKTAVVFGANASGKTKLFQAFKFMSDMVFELANDNKYNWKKDYAPFALAEDMDEKSSSFEVVFTIDGIQYRYGFEIDGEKVLSEWLYRKKKEERCVLYRDEVESTYHATYISSSIADNLINAKMVRDDTLFLATLAVWNDKFARKVVGWFSGCNVLSASTTRFAGFSLGKLNTSMKDQILTFMQTADFNIEDMFVRETDTALLPDEIKERIKTVGGQTPKIIDGVSVLHKTFDHNGLSHGKAAFLLEREESYGTYRMFALSAPIIDTLQNGKVLFVDEIDNGLHSDLLSAIVALFSSQETNKYGAQLIINTHNRDLINSNLSSFLPDQIWITEKDRFGEATLKSVLDYKTDTTRPLEELFREGRFGGIPYLNHFMENVLKEEGGKA